MVLRNYCYCALLCATVFIGNLQAADIPEFASGLNLNGNPSTALFRAGVTTDGGSSYAERVGANVPLSLEIGIEVAPEHIGRPGRLYVVIALGDALFQYLESGQFAVWDGELGSLSAARVSSSLESSETLRIVEELALGPAGLADTRLEVYVAYDREQDANNLVYSASPMTFVVDPYDSTSLLFAGEQPVDTVVFDALRQRQIPILVYLPDTTEPVPVVLFSHGLGGNRLNVVYLGQHWSQRGYAVINLQHPGSDDSILDVPASELLDALSTAANLENSILRIDDVSAVLDQLEIWNADPASEFYQRFNLERIGMSGHSFGARTSQSVSGEDTPFIPGDPRDPRIDAAIMFSPSPPSVGDPEVVLAGVEIPWLLMTGTNDDSTVTEIDPEDRLLVFPALPAGNKYELVLFGAEHHAFTDRPTSLLQPARNPAHHGIIEAISTAFWDSFLQDDASARQWLDGEGAESILLNGDTWQLK